MPKKQKQVRVYVLFNDILVYNTQNRVKFAVFVELYESVIAANHIEDQTKRMLKIKKLLHELPEHNFETFHFIAQHLNLIASHGSMNKVRVLLAD